MPTRQRRSKPEKRDPLIALRIPPSLDDRLRAHLAAEELSISEYVRGLIERSLARRKNDPPLPTGITEGNPPPAQRVARAGRRSTAPAMCEHRTRAGAYCRRCNRVVA